MTRERCRDILGGCAYLSTESGDAWWSKRGVLDSDRDRVYRQPQCTMTMAGRPIFETSAACEEFWLQEQQCYSDGVSQLYDMWMWLALVAALMNLSNSCKMMHMVDVKTRHDEDDDDDDFEDFVFEPPPRRPDARIAPDDLPPWPRRGDQDPGTLRRGNNRGVVAPVNEIMERLARNDVPGPGAARDDDLQAESTSLGM